MDTLSSLGQRILNKKRGAKKQLCYRLTKHNLSTSKITDIIVLSRAKKAPEGFRLAGDINGMSLCFKAETTTPTTTPLNQLRYSLSPQGNGELRPAPPPPTNGVLYPKIDSPSNNDYENLVRVPIRPAPPRPPPPISSTYATITSYQGLEGIPFALNPKISISSTASSPLLPVIKAKTKFQIDKEFEYDFRLERDIKT
uniref:Multivesicular body subunit 12A n=1 Tax=Clastoptera arizonana TaxID=38151 RepID=A0A1B6CCU4_9HEMI